MADLLDQADIDALLAAVDETDAPEESQQSKIFSSGQHHRQIDDHLEVRPYDFKRPERVSKDQMLALQTLQEGFARNFGASLSGFLRTIVEVKVASCEQMTYSEFISGLPNPTSFNLLQADPLEGQMCFELSPLIIYPIIDRLLGGTNHELFIPQRPLTMIEGRLIQKILERAVSALDEAWSSITPLTHSVVGNESNPQLVQIVPPNEVVVVVGFEIRMSNRAGTMNLCIPFAVIEPIMEDLAAQSWFSAARVKGSTEFANRIGAELSHAALHISGTLARTTITLHDLRQLSVGDIITTEKLATSPIVVEIEGEPKLLGNVGQIKGKRAIKVSRVIRRGDRL
ncbi:MAG: flagellar motor switch protein FliM [Phycisphaerales bacterium]|nr:flagellar motor switch protein FliM [Phycisphaerales bacterium]